MANWRKVLVSGSNIEVNQISGSSLNLSAFSAAAEENKVLIVGESGSITTIAQNSLLGAEQSFRIGGQKPDSIAPITFDTSDLLLFQTSSDHGFSFTITDDVGATGTSSISLGTPQDLRTTATPTFANLVLGPDAATGGIIKGGSTGGTTISLTEAASTFKVGARGFLRSLIANDGTAEEIVVTEINRTAPDDNISSRFIVFGNDGNTVKGLVQQNNNLIVTSGSQVAIGKASFNIHENAKLHVSGGDFFLERGAITASGTPAETSLRYQDSPFLLTYNKTDGSFRYVSSSFVLNDLSSSISGAFNSELTSLSASVAAAVSGNAADITANQNSIDLISTFTSSVNTTLDKGIRIQAGAGDGTDGSSVVLGETASFLGTPFEIEVTQDGGATGTEEKLKFGLPNQVNIANLTSSFISSSGTIRTDNLQVFGNQIINGDITSSGNISSSGNLIVGGDVTLDGTLSFAGLSFIQNQATVLSGSTVFGSGSQPGATTHIFTGSVGVTGSLDVVGPTTLDNTSIDGTLGVTGATTLGNDASADNLTVNAISTFNGIITANGALTASAAISGSSHLFASLSVENHDQVVVYNTTTGQFFHTASSALQTDNILGPSGDGDGYDGLFDFEEDTPIGDAIDDINDLLEGLAPPQAPDLQKISGGSSLSTPTAKLSFGTAAGTVMSGTSSVDVSTAAGNTLSDANINDSVFSTTAGNDVRIGIVSASSNGQFSTISGVLNSGIAGDIGTFTNFPIASIGNGEKGVLAIYVNNNLVHSQSLSGSFGGHNFQSGQPQGTSVNANNTGFINLSATSSAHFTSTGQALTLFKHRSGSYQIGPGDQRQGYNFVRIEHQKVGSTLVTNYVDWINLDNQDALTETTTDLTFVGTGIKALSGIHHFTGYTGTYRTEIQNAYRDVYQGGNAIDIDFPIGSTQHIFTEIIKTGSGILHDSTNTVSFDGNTIDTTLPALDSAKTAPSASTLILTASYSVDTTDRSVTTLNSTTFVSVNGSVEHPMKSDLTLPTKALTGILHDNRSVSFTGNNSELTVENFITESCRLPSGSFNDQASVVTGSYISSRSLADSTEGYDTGLQVSPATNIGSAGSALDNDSTGNGSLVYPKTNYTGINHSPVDFLPNYSTITGTRHFFRAFKNNSGADIGTFSFKMEGATNDTISTFGGSLGASAIKVGLKYPGFTNLLDVATARPNTDLQTFGDGVNVGQIDTTFGTGQEVENQVNFQGNGGGGFLLGNHFIVLRITFNQDYTGYIRKIDFSDLA